MARRGQVATTSNRRRSVDNAFKISVNTENLGGSGSATKTFVLPAVGGPFDITDWGDGSSDLAVSGEQTHVYSATGTYTITINKITNNFRPCQFNDGGDELKIIDIENWGNIVWDTCNGAFRGCANMDISATDNPDFSVTSSMYTAFYKCSSITRHCTYNAPLAESWAYAFGDNALITTIPLPDTSGATTMAAIFLRCYDLTSLPAFDVSNVTTFTSAFQQCTSITSFPSEWDLSSGELFGWAFYDTESVSSFPDGWDFSSATDCRAMFKFNAAVTSFSADYDFDNVTQTKEMFRECTSLTSLPAYSFNSTTTFEWMLLECNAIVNIPNFPNSDQVTNFENAFREMGTVGMPTTLDMRAMDNGTLCFYQSTLPDAAYQLLIIHLDANNNNTGVVFHGSLASLVGNAPAIADRDNLVDVKGWTITDGDGTHAP